MSVILELGGRMVLLALALLLHGSHTDPELPRACWADWGGTFEPLLGEPSRNHPGTLE